MFGTSYCPGTVLLGHKTLIFEFSKSKVGGDQLLGKVHTNLEPKIQKRQKKKPPIGHQNPKIDPPSW